MIEDHGDQMSKIFVGTPVLAVGWLVHHQFLAIYRQLSVYSGYPVDTDLTNPLHWGCLLFQLQAEMSHSAFESDDLIYSIYMHKFICTCSFLHVQFSMFYLDVHALLNGEYLDYHMPKSSDRPESYSVNLLAVSDLASGPM